MSSEQQYRPLNTGEIISNGDQYLDVCGNWIGYAARSCGQEFTGTCIARRLVVVEQEQEQEQRWEEVADENYMLRPGVDQCRGRRPNSEWGKWAVINPNKFPCTIGEWLESSKLPGYLWEFRRPVEQVEPADESSSTLAATLQKILDDAICCNMNLQVERDKLKDELAASQRMYMEAMTVLQREINQHRETNRRLDEVCIERNALQEQLNERASEPRKADILEFLSFQVAVIPYLQSAVGKDAQRELTLVGRTLQMVGKAIESDRIGQRRDGESAGDGEGVDDGKK